MPFQGFYKNEFVISLIMCGNTWDKVKETVQVKENVNMYSRSSSLRSPEFGKRLDEQTTNISGYKGKVCIKNILMNDTR